MNVRTLEIQVRLGPIPCTLQKSLLIIFNFSSDIRIAICMRYKYMSIMKILNDLKFGLKVDSYLACSANACMKSK